ncbi:uncharacterized protein TNCV_4870411 [Trichonephila clavipes]|nr:uncharacterized protein TNCV_4870411 [Trichonephila clavipes]
MGASRATHVMGTAIPNVLQPGPFRMVQDETVAPNEGAVCAWMVADGVLGCTRAFLMMWWSSPRLVCPGRPEPGLRVNDISHINWSQHLHTT